MPFRIENASVSFGDWRMQDFSMEIPEGKFVSLVGPSGCGKTTVLKMLAGLVQPVSGRVLFGANDVTKIPAEQRGVGFVFQGDALFHHLNVLENVAFGLEMRKEKNIREKAGAALGVVHLDGFGKRGIDGLSGGERKRVAIARAIAFFPGLLLLDEPLSGLDANLREKMKLMLKEVQRKTGATVIMVTHDIDEAFPLSDLMVVMSNGRVEQSGSPVEIFRSPGTAFVKEFISDYMLAEAKWKQGQKKGLVELELPMQGRKRAKNVFVSLKRRNFRLE